jgi:hypothetical protein
LFPRETYLDKLRNLPAEVFGLPRAPDSCDRLAACVELKGASSGLWSRS